jgi:uncharacterized lipoprotein YddW (UPF0748 family)
MGNKTVCLWLALCVACFACWVPVRAQQAAESPKAGVAKANPVSGIFVSAVGTQYRDALRVDRFCEELRQLPFEEILLQVRVEGDALYDSKLAPRAPGVDAAFDPLGAVLRQMHARRVPGKLNDASGGPKKVIAWFDPYSAVNAKNPAGPNAQNVTKLHPDWLARRADGATADEDGNQFLEPCLTDVQLHLEQVIAELVKAYPLDGILLDNLGDPAGDGRWGYHPELVKQWQQASGRGETPDPQDPSWIKFRADRLSQAVAGLAAAARQARPGLLVAVAGDATGPAPAAAAQFAASSVYTLRRQDWPRWLAQGLGQRFYLKNFRAERAAADDFDHWLALAQGEAAPRQVQVINTVAGRLNESVDALAQLRRAATAGAGLALADFETPVADTGARQLFMSAVARAVLSPEAPRLRLPVPAAADATTSAGAAPAPAGVSRLRPVLRSSEEAPAQAGITPVPAFITPAPTRTTAQPNEPGRKVQEPEGMLPVPPPPPPLAEVVEEGQGELIPAAPGAAAAHTTAPGATGTAPAPGRDRTMEALNHMAGMDLSGKAIEQTPAPAPPPPDEYVTRRQMLADLLNDPRFKSETGPTSNLFSGDEQSLSELQKKFKNIF